MKNFINHFTVPISRCFCTITYLVLFSINIPETQAFLKLLKLHDSILNKKISAAYKTQSL